MLERPESMELREFLGTLVQLGSLDNLGNLVHLVLEVMSVHWATQVLLEM